MQYGLIGNKLGHSFSKDIHEGMSRISYDLVELTPEEVAPFLQHREFKGINVTIPYKEAVIPYLDELDESARRTGAVNTIVNRKGVLTGYNTDVDGLSALADHAGISFEGRKVTILGTGGASKAVAAAVIAAGAASVRFASRRPSRDDMVDIADTSAWADTEVIINATPVGMHPDVDASPVDLSVFPCLKGVIDCIYNPLRTRLILQALGLGIPAEGGLYMLVAQAVKAREHFLGIPYDDSVVEDVHDELLSSRRNTVLCGMPSCGKSTLARLLAQRSKREFIDTDALIERKAGISIPAIFERDGEAGFRALESEVIRDLRTMQGAVIATGGGAVISEDNVRNLKMNGRIILVERDLDLLHSGGSRPLSTDRQAIAALWEQRRDAYMAAADEVMDNNGSLEEALAALESMV